MKIGEQIEMNRRCPYCGETDQWKIKERHRLQDSPNSWYYIVECNGKKEDGQICKCNREFTQEEFRGDEYED